MILSSCTRLARLPTGAGVQNAAISRNNLTCTLGVDIVDMIMDDAVARVSHRRLAAARSTYYRSYVGPASRVYMRKVRGFLHVLQHAAILTIS